MFNTPDSPPRSEGAIVRRLLNRGKSRTGKLCFASGDYHEKYVPDSRFLQNPDLKKARKAALRKTPAQLKTTYSNLSAEAQSAIDTWKGVHEVETHEYLAKASPQAKAGLLHRKYNVPIVSPDIQQALNHHDEGLKSLRSKQQDQVNSSIQALGGKVHRQWVAPGMKLKGNKTEPTLHPAWANYAVSINDRGMHTDHLNRVESIKKSQNDASLTHIGETKPIPGVIGSEGISKGSKSKLGDLTTKYHKEILSNKEPFKGYKLDLMGKRHQARQAMAEELGYKIMPGNKPGSRIQVTGKRQIIQAQRKLSGTLPKPLAPERWADIKSNRPIRGITAPDTHPQVGLGGDRTRYVEGKFKPHVPGPERQAEYTEKVKNVESKLSGLTKGETERRANEATSIKGSLQKKAYQNIKALNPKQKHGEIFSKTEEAVNQLLHGSIDPKRSTNRAIEGEELARHAGTIGIPVKSAKGIRTQYRNLTLHTQTEAGQKTLRSGFLKSGAAFVDDVVPVAAKSSYPYLRSLAKGSAVAAGAGLGIYGANRLIRSMKKKPQQQMSSKGKVIQFALSDEEKQQRRTARRWAPGSLGARGQEIYTWGGRAKRITRDLANTLVGNPDADDRGRPRKKEWQKPWFHKALALGAISAGLTGTLGTRRGHEAIEALGKTKVGKYLSGVRTDYHDFLKSVGPKSVTETIKAKNAQAALSETKKRMNRNEVKNVLGMSSGIRLIRFADTLDYWHARDLSRNQAVVTAPAGQIRTRRKKHFYEKKDVREAGLLGIAATLGIGAWKGKGLLDQRRATQEAASNAARHPLEEWGKQQAKKGTSGLADSWTKTGWLKPRVRLSSKSNRIIRFGDKDTIKHDIAIGGIEGSASFYTSDKLLKSLANRFPIFNKTIPRLAASGVVGGVGTGIAGYGLNRLVRQKVAEHRQKRQQMSSRLRLIKFDDAGNYSMLNPPKGKRVSVIQDRYRKKIREQEISRHEANLGKSALAGAAVGGLLKGHAGAGIGAIAGAGIETAAIMSRRKKKDVFGDSTIPTRRIERVPYQAGALTAGAILAHKLYRGAVSFPGITRKV